MQLLSRSLKGGFVMLALCLTVPGLAQETGRSIHLQVPPQAVAGSSLPVSWTGEPAEGDFLSFIPLSEPEANPDQRIPAAQSPMEVQAPERVGPFEIRYFDAAGKILGRRNIRLTTPHVDLYPPAEIPLGRLIEVRWFGPDNRGDFLAISTVDAEPGDYLFTVKTSEGSPALMRAPEKPGTYKLSYIRGENGRVLGSTPLEVRAPNVWLGAPLEALRGSAIIVDWEGPDEPGDLITIVPAEAPEGTVGNSEKTSRGSPARIHAPMTVGPHEVRYVSGAGKITYAALPLDLLKEEVVLDVPARATRGSMVSVRWGGPEHLSDYLIIVPEGAPEGEEPPSDTNLALVSRGQDLQIKAPMTLGTHEVRYVNGREHLVLARAYLDLEDFRVTLHPPETAYTNQQFQVQFSGPQNPGDYLKIRHKDGRRLSYASQASAQEGSPATLVAPELPGDYEVCYMNSQSDSILQRAPVKVIEAEREAKEG